MRRHPLKLTWNACRYLHSHLRQLDALVADSIHIASCDIWPLLLQHAKMIQKQQDVVATGAMVTDQDGDSICVSSHDPLHHALQSLELSSAKHLVIPQYNES